MSSAPSPPQQLMYSTDLQFYIDELRTRYNGKRMQTPDGYDVAFYLNRDYDCEHVICGKGKQIIDYGRARRVPYIEYIILHDSTRVVRLNKKTKNICFVSRACRCIVICSVVRDKELKFVTMIYDRSNNMTYLNSFDNYSDYQFI
jgi:hypothetical protein